MSDKTTDSEVLTASTEGDSDIATTPVIEQEVTQNTETVVSVSDNCQADEPGKTSNALYSTEDFKIRIGNIHPHSHHSSIQKRLLSLNLKPKKIKKVDRSNFVFVTFKNEEERQNAMKVIDGHQWRGQTLTVRKADSAQDPYMMAQKRKADSSQECAKKAKLTLEEYKELVISSVASYSKFPIEEQLSKKHENMKNITRNLSRDMGFAYRDSGLPKSMYTDKIKYDSLIEPVKASPVTEGYRNKCEFTVGNHPITGEMVIGFRCGEYKTGVAVMPADDCKNVSQEMKDFANNFCKFISKLEWKAFDPTTSIGNWMNVLVRTSSQHELMIQPQFCHQDASEDDLNRVREKLKEFAADHPEITSLYVRFVPRQFKSHAETLKPPEFLSGSEVINEKLLGLSFQISPTAFFQVNLPGAELLYSQIVEFANIASETAVLDVCCGTGTIGMIMAKTAKTVTGIELIESAVKDAEINAQHNNITNIDFKCGKAEDVMPGLMQGFVEKSSDVVAIVDPPRAGLHQKVTQALRKCGELKRLVYVSCEPKSAVKNFVELMRPVSKRWKGEPFYIKKMLPIDMFPHTDKCELILLFQR